MVEEDRTSQRLVGIDILPITSDQLKFGPRRIRIMFEMQAAAGLGLDIADPRRRELEAQAVAFGQVMAALEDERTGSDPSVRAAAAVERMAYWYQDSAREAGTVNIPNIGRIRLVAYDPRVAIAAARSIAFAESLRVMGQAEVVGQINVQLRGEGGAGR